MGMIRIQKNPKRQVRKPETGEELAEGEIYEVEDSVHWRRRIQSGDVQEVAVVSKEKDKDEDEAARKAAAEARQKAEEEKKRKAEEEAEAKRKADEEAAKKAAKSSGKKK